MTTGPDAPQDPDEPLDVLPAGTLLHGYELLAVLGQGGFGITYRARHSTLGREVAIKEYLPQDLAFRHGPVSVRPRSTKMAEDFAWVRDRFLEEARTLVKLEGVPGIVRVIDLFESNGTAYTVMALARGDTLEQRLEKTGPLPAAVIDRLLWPLLEGLEQVHAVGFVHRDIKPANIILDAGDRPTLIDFGAARVAMAGRTVATLTAMYTPAYAAPEQFATARQGPWTDIYGLSATLYHAITGRRPPGAMDRTLDDTCEPLAHLAPPGFAPTLLAGIDAGMKVRPADRPQSIAAWRALLQRPAPLGGDTVFVRKAEPPPSPPPGPPGPPSQLSPPSPPSPAPPAPPPPAAARQKRPVVWLGIAATVLLLAIGGYVGASMFAGSSVRHDAGAAAAAETEKREEEARRQVAIDADARKKAEEAQAAQAAQAAAQLQRQKEEEERRQAESAAAAEKKRLDEEAQRQAEAAAEKKRLEEEAQRQAAASKWVAKDCEGCPDMVSIPGGSFAMGAPPGEEEREKLPAPFRGWAAPQRPVTISAAFSLARHEVTRGQYKAFSEATQRAVSRDCLSVTISNGQLANKPERSWQDPGFAQTDQDPVVCVSWEDAQAYAAWLSKTTGRTYRLPTEAEWEYAARAGTRTARYWSDDREGTCRNANVSDKTFLDWGHWQPDPDRHFPCADGFRTTAPVGRFAANGFGLHDMLGNVWEWVEDCPSENYKGASSGQEARLVGKCEDRVLRGGSWFDVPSLVRAAVRSNAASSYRHSSVGFRVARSD